MKFKSFQHLRDDLRRFGLLLSLSLCSVWGLALGQQATTAENPYEAVVDVEDESDSSRSKAMRAALIIVLKRVVGRYDSATGAMLDNASNYVQQYNFIRDPSSEKLQFRAVFDPNGVAAAVKSEGLPVFGIDSDVVEAWIVDVHGLRSANDFSRVYEHFAKVGGIRRLEVTELHDSTVRLRMIVEGGVERASKLISAGGLLRQDGESSYVLVSR